MSAAELRFINQLALNWSVVVAEGGVMNPLPPLQVLIAEDDEVSRDVALLLLDRLGLRADVAANGIEALAAIESHNYDVALMDVQMPLMDGMEASRRIRSTVPASRQPIVVAMSANGTSSDQMKYAEAGMEFYLPKPIQLKELAAMLTRCGSEAGA
jgi:CheY-like chemotaxis protein